MSSIETLGHATLNGNTYELRLVDHGTACCWYHEDESIEVGGDNVADACEQLWLREGQPSDVDWYTPIEVLDASGGPLLVGSRVCWDVAAPHIESSMVYGPLCRVTGEPVSATGTVERLWGSGGAVLVRWDDGSASTAHGSWLEIL